MSSATPKKSVPATPVRLTRSQAAKSTPSSSSSSSPSPKKKVPKEFGSPSSSVSTPSKNTKNIMVSTPKGKKESTPSTPNGKKNTVSTPKKQSPLSTPNGKKVTVSTTPTGKKESPVSTPNAKKESPVSTPSGKKNATSTPKKESPASTTPIEKKSKVSTPKKESKPSTPNGKTKSSPSSVSGSPSPKATVTVEKKVTATIQPSPVKKGFMMSGARQATSALATAKPITVEYEDQDESEEEESEEEEDDDDEEDDQDQDSDLEEGQDASEKGMQRLIDALGDDGLNEMDLAALQEMDVDEDEDEEDDEEDDEDEEVEEVEEDEEDEEEEETNSIVKSTGSSDTLAASLLRSGLVSQQDDQEDEDDDEEDDEDDQEALTEDDDQDQTPIDYEDLPDDIELSEAAKASRVQRIKVNNKSALTQIHQDIQLDKLSWIETMRITYDQKISDLVSDPENDLERELAFYKQALYAAVEGKKRIESVGTVFTRPSDFFAEMVKSDDHMERIRQKLLDETAGIKASEEAKRQRHLKKFGKKVQIEKLQQRLHTKKQLNESIQSLKRKHKGDDDGKEEDQFDVQLEHVLTKQHNSKDGDGGDGSKRRKSKMPRTARDQKYGHGGKKKYSKENTAQSSADFSFGGGSGSSFKGGKKRNSFGGGSKKSKPASVNRPGKSRRIKGRK